MKGRHLVPAPAAVVIGILEIMFGLCCLLINLSNINQNTQFIENADKVVAVCTVSSEENRGPDAYLKSTVAYTYNDKKYENIVIDNYHQGVFPGQEIDLYVNPDRPTQCKIHYDISKGQGKTYTLFSVVCLSIGSLMTIVGISRIKKGNLW